MRGRIYYLDGGGRWVEVKRSAFGCPYLRSVPTALEDSSAFHMIRGGLADKNKAVDILLTEVLALCEQRAVCLRISARIGVIPMGAGGKT